MHMQDHRSEYVQPVETLAEKAKIFWELSSIWNGRTEQEFTVGQALQIIRTNIPDRPSLMVDLRLKNLRDEIISRAECAA